MRTLAGVQSTHARLCVYGTALQRCSVPLLYSNWPSASSRLRNGVADFGELTKLQTEIVVWSDKTNAKQRGVDWQFRIENARVKLKRLYPKIKA